MKKRKTKKLTSKTEWTCPVHHVTVESRIHSKYDTQSGKTKYAGEYFGCPSYHECKYYVSPSGDIPILDTEAGSMQGLDDHVCDTDDVSVKLTVMDGGIE